jgi:hypothetical protein
MPVATLFSWMRDDKRTVYVNWQDHDKLLEIWKHIRQAAVEPTDDPPQITERKSVEFNLLGQSGSLNGVTYWVIEKGIADQVNLAAFGRTAEADLVQTLRRCAKPFFSFVAEYNHELSDMSRLARLRLEAFTKGLAWRRWRYSRSSNAAVSALRL